MDAEANREPDRFRALYDANHDRVHRLLRGIVGPQDADDLTQIVFAKVARALQQFRGEAQASTWLYRIAANPASDGLPSPAARAGKETVHRPEVQDGETAQASATIALPEHQSSPEQRLVRKEMHDHIRRE